MGFSDYFGLAVACAFGVLAVQLADNQFAKDHHWLIPALWSGSVLSLVLAVLQKLWFRTTRSSQGAAGPRTIHQEAKGYGNSATAVDSIRDIGAGAHVEIGSNATHLHSQRLPPPRVAFVDHGLIPTDRLPPLHVGQTGFRLANDGETAYEVLIEPFEIQPSVWATSKESSRIQANGEEFALVWLNGCPPAPFNVGKWDLLGAMRKAADAKNGQAIYRPNYTVSVVATCRDADNQWYRTTAPLTYIPSQHRLEFGASTFESCGQSRPLSVTVPSIQLTVEDPEPQLQFVEWQGAGHTSLPTRWPNETKVPSWIVIRNSQITPSEVAKNVAARLEFVNSSKTKILIVPEAVWWEFGAETPKGNSKVPGPVHTIDIDGGDDQAFVFFAEDGRRLIPYKDANEPLEMLEFDGWTVKMIVTSDNMWGFEGTIGFIQTSKTFTSIPFSMQRSVMPRLQAIR